MYLFCLRFRVSILDFFLYACCVRVPPWLQCFTAVPTGVNDMTCGMTCGRNLGGVTCDALRIGVSFLCLIGDRDRDRDLRRGLGGINLGGDRDGCISSYLNIVDTSCVICLMTVLVNIVCNV